MEYGTFTADVRPGGLTEELEIKLLICYLLHHIRRGMSFAEINEVFRSKGIANYFEYSQEISRLLASGHIEAHKEIDGVERYYVTDLGIKTSITFEKDNRFQVEPVEDGYNVTMTITDIGSDLLRLTLFVPKESDCEQIRENFYNDPAFLYRGIIAMLTGDERTVRDILERNER